MKQCKVYYHDDIIHWAFNNKFHRDEDLPSTYYFFNGKLDVAYYHQHDKRHRTTGPAFINYKSKIKRYYYQDYEYASLEEIKMVEACR